MLAEKFAKLFSGHEDAHGQFVEKKGQKGGKLEGDSWTRRGSPDWTNHLEGRVGLGIVPLRIDNSVSFAAIDIDDYSVDLKKLEKRIRKLRLPLIVCRSKSGGAHCYVFFKDPVPAGPVISKLKSWASSLGYAKCRDKTGKKRDTEIFPKQSKRVDNDDIGNWINMPYFGGKNSTRYALSNGKALTPEQFLEIAYKHRITEDDLHKPDPEDSADHPLLAGAPPCLKQFYLMGGISSGIRNETMFNAAVFCKKKWPEEWRTKLHELNHILCDPPIPEEELEKTIIKSISKRDSYEMRCNGPYCNKSKCGKADHGRGLGIGALNIDVTEVTKVESPDDDEDAVWFLEINEKRIKLDTAILLHQHRFRQHILDKLTLLMPSIKASAWTEFLQEQIISQTIVVQLPEETAWVSQFLKKFEEFCSAKGLRGNDPRDLDNERMLLDDGCVIFHPNTLMTFLREHRFAARSMGQIWWALVEKGAVREEITVDEKVIQVWKVPKPKEVQSVVVDFKAKKDAF